MKLSISQKIVTIATTSVIFSSIVALCINFIFFDQLLHKRTQNTIRSSQAIVSRLQDQDTQRVLQAATMISAQPQLVAAIQAGDLEKVKEIAKVARDQLNLDAVTITDAKGIAIARGHSSRVGDDLSKRSTMQMAFKGIVKVGILFEPSAVVPFSIRCDAPIYAGNRRLTGVLSLGVSLGTEAYIDGMKTLTGLECTMFSGDTRAMTTLKDKDGKRSIGTKLQDADVLDKVLQKGETVHRKSGAALRTIVTMADDTARQVEGIVKTCEHQAAASEHVNRSIAEVSAIAATTHTSMETASRDIDDLAVQTDGLVRLVAEMKRG